MAKTQPRIKTDYKAMEESRGMVQQCSACGIRYRSHEVQPLCSDCEEQQAAQVEAPVVKTATAPLHTCDCGATFEAHGWNNNVNKILRCEACTQKRDELLSQIAEAIAGRNVETVYVSNAVRNLIQVSDLTTVEIGYRREERMNGQFFQVVEA